MYISEDGKMFTDKYTSCWENRNYRIFWEGFIFISGTPSGEDSANLFTKKVEKIGIKKACNYLSGRFSCIIQDKVSNKSYAFVDNSGLYPLFYDKNSSSSSSSFFDLINQSTTSRGWTLNPHSVVEFIYSGFVFRSKTLLENINVVEADEILNFSDSGIVIIKKDLKSTSSCPREKISERFENIAASLKNNNKIELDLSGGTDTRLLAIIFDKYGVEFDVASWGMPDDPDVEIAKKLADLLGLNLHITYHNVENINLQRELEHTFETFYGMIDILDYHHRYQVEYQRKKRGVELVVRGSGGELYKKGRWWQSNRKNETTIEKLVDLGQVNWYSDVAVPHNIFSNHYREISLRYKSYLLGYMIDTFGNSEKKITCGKIFYEYSVKTPVRYDNARFTKYYLPLLDRNIVPYGFCLPWSGRIFNTFYRKLITSMNREAARLVTTDGGMTISSEISYVLKDLGHRYASMSKRLMKGCKYNPSVTTNPNLYCKARGMQELTDNRLVAE